MIWFTCSNNTIIGTTNKVYCFCMYKQMMTMNKTDNINISNKTLSGLFILFFSDTS